MSNLDFEYQVIEIYLKYLLGQMCTEKLYYHKVNAKAAAGVPVLVRSVNVLMSGKHSPP